MRKVSNMTSLWWLRLLDLELRFDRLAKRIRWLKSRDERVRAAREELDGVVQDEQFDEDFVKELCHGIKK
jgi:hypothetical protein